MTTLRAVMATFIVSFFAVMTVVHLNMVKVDPTPSATLDMLKVMAEAFNEGGEGPGGSGEGSVCSQHALVLETIDPSTNYPYGGCVDIVTYHYCTMEESLYPHIIFVPIIEYCVEGLQGKTVCNGIVVQVIWAFNGPNIYPCGGQEAH